MWVLLFTLPRVWCAKGRLSTLLAVWVALCRLVISNLRVILSPELFLELLLFAWPELLKESTTAQVDLVGDPEKWTWNLLIQLQNRRKEMCYECQIRAQIIAHTFLAEQSPPLGACTQIPDGTYVRWLLRNTSNCCPPQSVRSQPVCRESQSYLAVHWVMLMLSAAVRLPGTQDRDRLWGVSYHRPQGIILFWCLGACKWKKPQGLASYPETARQLVLQAGWQAQ